MSNTAYDASLQEYCSNCEESQGFSPTFNAFAKKLAQTWIDRYQIRNKTILEIGCGKGEFLVLMCDLGDNRGIGIDPSYQPHRTPEEFRSASSSSRIITTKNTPISPPTSSFAATRSST